MIDLTLSKYAFGFKVKSFISMLSWTGIIMSIFGGLISLFPIVIVLEFDCYTFFDKLPCGLIFGFGAISLAFEIIWFCLNLFLGKKNNEDDLVRVTEILRINCYAQGSLAIFYSVIILVLFDAIKHQLKLKKFIIYSVTIPIIIVSILMIIGVAMQNPLMLIVYIVICMTSVILLMLSILGFSIYLSFFTNSIISGIPFLSGLIAFFGIGLFSIYWMGYVVTLQTITKKMNQVRNY